MRKSFTLLLILASYNLFTQDSCVVKIFPGDCQNCYLGIKAVENYEANVKKTLVFPKLNDSEIEIYLKTVLGIYDKSSYTIIVSDSVYNCIDSTLTSEIYVFDQNRLSNHSQLRYFHGFPKNKKREIKIPDSIGFSPSVTLLNSIKYFFVVDSKFGQCVFITNEDGNQIRVVKMPELTTATNFYKIAGDSLCYSKFLEYREVLEGVKMDRMKVNHIFNTNGNMY